MNQNDFLLLQTAPPYHLQAIVKARRLPVSVNGQNVIKPDDPSSMTIAEIAQYLFDPASCIDALNGLAEMEKSIVQELIACGGRANSRDLALYFSCLQVPLDDASEPERKSSSLTDSSKISARTQAHHRVVTLQRRRPSWRRTFLSSCGRNVSIVTARRNDGRGSICAAGRPWSRAAIRGRRFPQGRQRKANCGPALPLTRCRPPRRSSPQQKRKSFARGSRTVPRRRTPARPGLRNMSGAASG